MGDAGKPRPLVFYLDKRVLVVEHETEWVALVGIPLSVGIGTHRIKIKKVGKPDDETDFLVKEKEYEAQYITIKDKRKVNPNPQDLERIKKERIPINKALMTWTEQPTIDTDFSVPVDGRLSSPFGLRRFFNNQPRKPHSGLDIAAPSGTSILAPAKGQVINTGNYFFNGNTVFLDHGQGLITGYFHMSEIKVKPGQGVTKGDVLGAVGATGRVTGAHLHWNVYLNRTKVDPALFVGGGLSKNSDQSEDKLD